METLFFDDDIAVVIKDVGVDSEHEMPNLIAKTLGGGVYTLHRLDKSVSGVMVYARNKKSASALSSLIQKGEMIKEYLALVHGETEDKGTFEDLLFKDSKKNKVFVVNSERRGVKRAKLEYETLKKGERSLVKIRLHTGRSHQIRVQFASRKHSLVGDRKYGAKDSEKFPMLYSYKITFPYKNEMVSFESFPEWAK